MEVKFPITEVKIGFTFSCPTCGSHEVPPEKLRWIIGNQMLSLASDIVIAKNQLKELNPHKEKASILLLQQKLEKMEQEHENLNSLLTATLEKLKP